jgi:O-antigen/teichoic acid export membrane protein
VRAINLDSANEREHLGNTLITKTLLAIIIFLVMTGSLIFTDYNYNTIYLILIFGLVRIGNEYMTAFYALYEAKERFNISSIFNFIFSLSILSTTFIVVLYKGNYFHFAYTRLLIVIIILLLLAIYTFKDFEVKFSKTTMWGFLKSAIPFGLYSVFWYSLQRINILVLSFFHGTRPVGYFNNGFIFLVTLTFVPANMNKVLIPFLYKISYEKEKHKYQFTFDIFSKLFGIVSFYIFIMLFLFAGHIIVILYGDKYNQSIPVLEIISFSIPFLFNIASTIITALDHQHINTKIVGYALVMNLILNCVFIHFLEANGAAIAAVLTFLFIFIMSHLFIYKNRILSLRKVGLVYVRLTIVSVIVYFLHHFFMTKLNWIITACVDSIVFAALTLLFMIREDDVRILRETIFNKNDLLKD